MIKLIHTAELVTITSVIYINVCNQIYLTTYCNSSISSLFGSF